MEYNGLRILVLTQKIDENDAILGFFCGWLNELAKRIDKVYVLALEVKNASLANNIELYSLGKENDSNRLRRFFKSNQVLSSLCLNKKINIIFIHMCPEYAILAWLYAKLKNITMVMWYAHGYINVKLRIAHFLVNKVITPSRKSFRIKSNKVLITGHGIDINKFQIPNSKFQIKNNGKKIILSVGRISPIKNYETLIKSANVLINNKQIRDLEFQIAGGATLESQNKYLCFLKNMVSKYGLENHVKFVGPIPYAQIQNYYQNCDLFVSTSNTGSLDKALLEAMACGKIIFTCNEAFSELLKNYSHILMFGKNDAYSLAEKIISILKMDAKDRNWLACILKEIVIKSYNLNRFIDNILAVFQDTL